MMPGQGMDDGMPHPIQNPAALLTQSAQAGQKLADSPQMQSTKLALMYAKNAREDAMVAAKIAALNRK